MNLSRERVATAIPRRAARSTASVAALPFFLVMALVTAGSPGVAQEHDPPATPAGTSAPSPAPAASPAPVASPTPAPVPPLEAARSPRSLGPAAFDTGLLEHLPLGHGVWSIFETVESTAILDRMESGGLYVGEAGLLGVRGSSWTQASWLLGDLDITDPDRTGTPLLLPDPETLEAIEISSGLMPADQRGSGPAIGLAPRRPGSSWHRSLRVDDAPSSFQQTFQGTGAPAIAHIESFASGGFRVDGPLIENRLGVLVSGSFARGARRERSDPRPLRGQEAGLLAHLVFTPTAHDEVRLLGAVQNIEHPYAGRARFGGGDVRESDQLFQVQTTWQRGGTRPWSLTTGLVRGVFGPKLPDVALGAVERLADGPVQEQFPGASSRGRWALSGWFDPFTTAHHGVRVGGSLGMTRSITRPAGPLGLTPETVGGLPARVWDYGWRGPSSVWHGSEISAYATDQFRYRQLAVDAGVRYETSRATAAGSDVPIEWTGVTPRLVARVRPFPDERPHLVMLAGYAEYLNRLPLSLVAYGDAAAAQGVAYRWLDTNGDGVFQARERGALVAQVGPGGPFASIDPGLKPPRSREVFLGFETEIGQLTLRALAYHRRERDLVTSVNYGAPASAYDVYYVPDPSSDIAQSNDDSLLPVYNRRPETFGQDRYLLTNDVEKGTGKGLEISVDGRIGKRVRLVMGVTASKTLSPSAYRGFLAIENDQGLVGERLELPNATTFSVGRLFFERGYTIKIAGTYRAPLDFHLGVVARYQDGQHFARFVIPTDLNQGPEPIKGINNGASRFTYVLTVDARVDRSFAVRRARLAAVVEAFNLLGSAIEVEEDVIWGPSYRATSAVQPPRAVRLGLRLDF